MKLLNQKAYEFGLILVISVLITACVSDPVIVDLSANHPANPRSPEIPYIPPPNPFQYTMPMVENAGDDGSSMTHEDHPPAHQHQMSPRTGHDHMPSQGSEEQNPQHQHKEHSQ